MPRILSKYYPATKILFVLGEGIFIAASILLAMLIRFGFHFQIEALTPHGWAKIALMVFVCQLSLYYNDLYDLKASDSYQEIGLRLTQSLGISSIILAIIYYGFPAAIIGRGVFLISIFFLVIFVCSWRYLYSWTLKKRMFTENLMIIGCGELARTIIQEIALRRDSGYRIAAVLDNPAVDTAGELPDIPLYSDFDKIYEQSSALTVRKIVVALDEKRGKLPTGELLRCKMEGIPVLDGISFYEELTGKILIEKLQPSWLIFSSGFKKSRLTRIGKRIVGMGLSLVGLMLTLPLNLIIALAIKLDSPGPVFYSQERCGEGNRLFKLYKFRSMTCDAEQSCGAVWTTDDDPRITRVGRVIRKIRIDEIPQMWNVLKGDMSFVGPRPERPEFINDLNKLIPFYAERHNVKPGVTGWAQICYPYGASVEDAKEKLKYDLFYVKNMNFLFDLTIIFRTIKIVLLGRGAR